MEIPNFELSPPDAAHFPDPVAETFTRTPNLGTNAQLLCLKHQRTEFGIFLENRNDVLAELLTDQQQPDHDPVFVAIADQQRPVVFEMRKRRNKFRLGTALQTKTKRPARFQNFLNHFVKLIHFDRDKR